MHYLSTIDSTVQSVFVRSYSVWDPVLTRTISRLNVIYDYNQNMNSVDISYQLRNQYRVDHTWWRNTKWSWSIFIWILGVTKVNSYIIYKRSCKQHKKEPIKHLDFTMQIAEARSDG